MILQPNVFISLFISYLLGAIPFGLLLSNIFGNGKLREQGSKNIGSTNVLRTQGKTLAVYTLLFDTAKASIAVYLFHDTFIAYAIFAIVIIGHMFPIWLKFKGGKGIACFFGGIIILEPVAAVIFATTWLSVFYISRISSISGLGACTLSTLYLIINTPPNQPYSIICILLVYIIIVYKHYDNIKRFISHQELKI